MTPQAAKDILARLYKAQPSAKAAIEKVAGYATFSNFGMKMFEIQAGLGFGVKKFSLVWVFETPETLGTFINSGWELGGQTSVAAKAGDKGGSLQGALAIAPGVWLYQLTDKGLALELAAKGTKYSKDDDLN